jgi:hypothetical protein
MVCLLCAIRNARSLVLLLAREYTGLVCYRLPHRLFPVPLDRRRGCAVEDQRQGSALAQQATGRRPALACDLSTVTGCPARGDGRALWQARSPARRPGHGSRRGAGQQHAAAAAPVGLPPGRARQTLPPRDARMPATPAGDGGMPRRSGAPVAESVRTRSGPRPSAAGAAGALKAVESSHSSRLHKIAQIAQMPAPPCPHCPRRLPGSA